MTKFIPEDGQKYWILTADASALAESLYVMRGAIKYPTPTEISSNCFRTKKEASEALKKIKAILKND